MTITEMIEIARTLTPDQRLELLQGLVEIIREPVRESDKHHSLKELRGLGKEVWNTWMPRRTSMSNVTPGSHVVKVSAAFQNVKRVYLDAAPLIYYVETHPTSSA